jgi:hypothetical protein
MFVVVECSESLVVGRGRPREKMLHTEATDITISLLCDSTA